MLGETEMQFPAERNHAEIDAVEKDMLLILDIISFTQVTGGGITLIPSRCLKTKGVIAMASVIAMA